MVIAKIILPRRMPRYLSLLDYLVPDELADSIKVGQLTAVPFRNKEIFGVIAAVKQKENFTEQALKKTKSISKIIFSGPLLSLPQINFLNDLAEFYHTSLGFLLKENLPPLQKKKLASLELKFKNNKSLKQAVFTAKPRLFIYQTEKQRDDYLKKNLAVKEQNLILVPELKSINKLPKSLLKKAIIISSQLSPKELFKKWWQIYEGEKIIIGTRRALFLPWHNLENIFLTDESNPNYKSWDMTPRYQTRDAALFLAKQHNATLHLLTHTPSVETYFFAKKKIYLSTNLSTLNQQSINKFKSNLEKEKKQDINIIDMRDERHYGNYGCFSNKLTEKILQVKNGDIFVFLNRRGASGYVGCRDCGQVLKCPKCDLLLTFHNDNNLRCHYCGHKQFMARNCEKCHGINMNMLGAGTQLAENQIRKLMVGKNNTQVVRIDSDQKDMAYKNTSDDRNKIIIGTQLAWPFVDWEKVKLMVFLDADTSLFVPEYKINENLWYNLRDAKYKLNKQAELLIQTSHPDHLVFTALSSPLKFYEQELKGRQILGYPPFRFLLKLLYGHVNKQVVENEAGQVFKTLSELTKNESGIKLSGPLETTPEFYGGKYWLVILAKIRYDNYKSDVKMLLSGVPEYWKVDPNPNEVLQL